jgi:hypothetical protein
MAAEEEKKRHYPTNDNGSCSGEPLDPRILRVRGVRTCEGRSKRPFSARPVTQRLYKGRALR